MKKKPGFPTVFGIITAAVIFIAYQTPLLGYYNLWPWFSTDKWAYFIILYVPFWLMGAAMYLCAVGRGGFRIKLPQLIAGGAMTMYMTAAIIYRIFGLIGNRFFGDFIVDFLNIFISYPHNILFKTDYAFEQYFPHVFCALAGYLLACGLYGKRKADVTDKEDREP